VIASPVGSYFKGGPAPVSIWVSENYTRAAVGGSSFRSSNASMGAASPSFAGRAPVVASGGGRNWNGGGWHGGGWNGGGWHH